MDANAQRLMSKIEGLYNPDHDLNPAGPAVNWVEMALVEIIKSLIARITKLETELKERAVRNENID
ncbi:MAG: hypothetical protein WC837_04485 [Bellilinea sp.]